MGHGRNQDKTQEKLTEILRMTPLREAIGLLILIYSNTDDKWLCPTERTIFIETKKIVFHVKVSLVLCI